LTLLVNTNYFIDYDKAGCLLVIGIDKYGL
jgi:hypothetical protein